MLLRLNGKANIDIVRDIVDEVRCGSRAGGRAAPRCGPSSDPIMDVRIAVRYRVRCLALPFMRWPKAAKSIGADGKHLLERGCSAADRGC